MFLYGKAVCFSTTHISINFVLASDCISHERIDTYKKLIKCLWSISTSQMDCIVQEKVHTDEILYKCQQSKKDFINRSDCFIHGMIHTDENLYWVLLIPYSTVSVCEKYWKTSSWFLPIFMQRCTINESIAKFFTIHSILGQTIKVVSFTIK